MHKTRLAFTPLHPENPTLGKGVTGFTLIELMVVIALIIVLITIITPNILRSRVVANETSALAACRSINNACQLYHINHEKYPASLVELAEPASNPPYIDNALGTGHKNSYDFIYTLADDDHFILYANPSSSGLLRGKYYYTDESGIIRVKSDGQAGPTDEIVG